MRIVLIQPPISMTERYGKYAGRAGVSFPSWTLALLGAVIRYNVAIIDCETEKLDYEDCCERVKCLNPDVIGITATTVSIHNAGQLAKILKTVNRSYKIIIGGAHISAVPEETMECFKYFDIGVIGEGEETVLDLLENIDNLENVKGIIYRDDDRLIKTEPREFIKDLDSLPFPNFNLLPDIIKHTKPAPLYFKELPIAPLISSRGCYGKCTFCDRTVSGNKMRFHSAEYVVSLMEKMIKDYGIKEFMFYDDLFLVNKKRIFEICDLLDSKRIKVSWSVNARIDSVDLETLKRIKKSGCWHIGYGIESGSQEILNSINKNIILDKVKKVLEWTKIAGLKSKGYFMLGLLQDTKETFEETKRFILDIPLDFLTLNVFTPFPNTPDYLNASKYGRFNDDWRLLNQHNVVFIPREMNSEYIEKMRKNILAKFYFRPKIMFSFLKSVLNFNRMIYLMKGFMVLMMFIFPHKYKFNIREFFRKTIVSISCGITLIWAIPIVMLLGFFVIITYPIEKWGIKCSLKN